MSQLPVNSHFAAAANPMINHALAAHLFFQNPLLPPPNQWLYNHLYNNYNDFPWLRHTLVANSLANSEEAPSTAATGLSFIKRSITLLTNNNNNNLSNENDSDSSPAPVSSTKRSPSPDEECAPKRKRCSSADSLTKENSEISMKSEGFLTRRAPCVKQNDVWRPY